MKKAVIAVFAVFILVGFVSCKKNRTVVIWSYDNELERLINGYYLAENPDFEFNYSVTPVDQFTAALDPVLASGRGTPDIFTMEAGFVRRYVESGLLLDLTDIYEKHRDKLLAYPAQTGTFNDRVFALSWQAFPGVLLYRRSLAQKYIGTDNPLIVQSYFSSFNLLARTAALLKERSKGVCVVTANCGELFNVFLSARRFPWITGGSLVIDPVMEEYMDFSKIFLENRYDARADQWSENWFAGLNGSLVNEEGEETEVFSWFIPSQFFHNGFISGAPDTYGDWAVIPGPSPYYSSGVWIGAWKDTANMEAVKGLIEYLTCNDAFLEKYALDSGILTTNINVSDRIASSFSEPFLGGQNHYEEFFEIAKNINGALTLSADKIINELFIEQVTAYIHGEKTKDQALADFRQSVNVQFELN